MPRLAPVTRATRPSREGAISEQSRRSLLRITKPVRRGRTHSIGNEGKTLDVANPQIKKPQGEHSLRNEGKTLDGASPQVVELLLLSCVHGKCNTI